MFDFIFGRKLEKVLYETKKIRVSGIYFRIKKVNMLNYIDGSKVLVKTYDTHKTAAAKAAAPVMSEKELKRHYTDILVSGVVEPKLVYEKTDPNDKSTFLVTDLFIIPDLVGVLYNEIMYFTYGKKKVKRAMLAEKDLSK